MRSELETTASGRCLTCGAALSGRYCSQCGEKAVHEGDLKLSHQLHDIWHEATHLDGRLWGSFGALLFRPGQLTKDYWEGRRGLWMRPLRIFLIVTALSLVLAPDAAGPLGMKVYVRQGARGPELTVGTRPPSALPPAKGLQVGPAGQSGAQATFELEKPMAGEDLAQLNEKIHKIYKVIQYVSLALFAAISLLLSRRVQPYYGAHLILALHYYSFEYVLTGVANRLSLNPQVPLGLGIVYLILALWRLVGGGRSSGRSYGADWASFWRAAVLSSVVAIAELLVMSVASGLALRLH